MLVTHELELGPLNLYCQHVLHIVNSIAHPTLSRPSRNRRMLVDHV